MKYCLFAINLLILTVSCSQTIVKPLEPIDSAITTIALLPDLLSESSGLEITAPEIYWSHNDHKGAAQLYAFDDDGTLLRTLTIDNATNEDWEDMAKDKEGNLYIGDFGNNDNDRKDLKIYKIANPQLHLLDNVNAEIINFKFKDQKAFPPNEKEMFFDIEAMFIKGTHIFLLSRDRSKPFSGKTRLYQLLNSPGNQEAVFLAEFETNPKKNKGQITSADISPDEKKLVILANEALWIFQDFQGNNFFSGEVTRMDLPWNYQMEAVAFEDNKTIFLTNEKQGEHVARLHRIKL